MELSAGAGKEGSIALSAAGRPDGTIRPPGLDGSGERGQGLVEYALIIFLVAIVVIAILLLLGPQIGAKVTDFSLADAQGRTHSIRSAAGPKGTMLVFFRSADW